MSVRPIYETTANRRNARRIMDAMGWLAASVEMPPLWHYDFDLSADSGTWQAEVKARDHAYPEYMLDMPKVNAMLAEPMPLLVIAWRLERRIGVCRMKEMTFTERMGGRTDRGDPLDRKPCAYIPLRHFAIVPEPAVRESLWEELE